MNESTEDPAKEKQLIEIVHIIKMSVINHTNSQLNLPLFLHLLSSLHSYKMSGQSSRTELSPEEDLGSTKSESAAALCWPKCVIAKLSDEP